MAEVRSTSETDENAQLRQRVEALEHTLKMLRATGLSYEYTEDNDVNQELLFYLKDDRKDLNRLCSRIVKSVQPSPRSELKRAGALSYLKNLIRKRLFAQLYPHGAFGLKTYLLHDDVEVCAFFSQVHESTWVQRFLTVLCDEASKTSKSQYSLKNIVVKVPDADEKACAPMVECSVLTNTGSSSSLVNIRIRSNQVGALGETALMEYVNDKMGKDNLFKRSLLLTNSWASHVGILGAAMLPPNFFRAVMLYIFNAYHAELDTELQAFYHFLFYVETFNWSAHALTLYGPVSIKELPIVHGDPVPLPSPVTRVPSEWPNNAEPLISPYELKQFMVIPTVKNIPPSSNKANTLTVLSPVDHRRNLSSIVSTRNEYAIRHTMRGTASRLRKALYVLSAPAEDASFSNAAFEEDMPRSMAFVKSDSREMPKTESGMLPKTVKMRSGMLTSASTPNMAQPNLSSPKTSQDSKFQKFPRRQNTMHTLLGEIEESQEQPDKGDLLSLEQHPVFAVIFPQHVLRRYHYEQTRHPRAFDPTPRPSERKKNAPNTDILSGHAERLNHNLSIARQFQTPQVSEEQLVEHIQKILHSHGAVAVGRLGSLLHEVIGNHTLPALLKEMFGGLKRLLERHEDLFALGQEHPLNPSVRLLVNPALEIPDSVVIPTEEEVKELQAKFPRSDSRVSRSGSLSHMPRSDSRLAWDTDEAKARPSRENSLSHMLPRSESRLRRERENTLAKSDSAVWRSERASDLRASMSDMAVLENYADNAAVSTNEGTFESQRLDPNAPSWRPLRASSQADGNNGSTAPWKVASTPDSKTKVPAWRPSRRNTGDSDYSRSRSSTDEFQRPSRNNTGDLPRKYNTGDRPSRNNTGDRPSRHNTGDRPSRNNTGDRPSRHNTGDRPSRHNTGDRPSDRPSRNNTGGSLAERMMDQKAYRRERGRSRNSNMVINPEMAAILKRRNLTSRMALKCVSVGTGPEGKKNVLARCSVVNYDGEVIFDKFVKSPEPITAFRTNVSGIKPNDIRDDNAISYQEVQSSMRILLKDRVVIGHCVDVDLHAMLLHHPAKMLRDCATCVLLCPEAPIPLVDLIKTRLNMDVPSGPDAVQEARHCMLLYRTFEEAWETSLNVLSAKTPRGSGREPRRNATR